MNYCSFYKDSKDVNGEPYSIKLTSILSAIKNGKFKDRIIQIREEPDKKTKDLLKRSLPNFSPSGVFSARYDNKCTEYSKLMCADIDKISTSKLKSLKRLLSTNKHVLSFFVSPNFGLKVIIMIDSTIDMHNKDTFYTIEKMFKDMYNVTIDKKCKNVSRICYISYDPDLYYNPDCVALHIEKLNLRELEPVVSLPESFIPETNASTIFDKCRKIVKGSTCGGYHKGNRNNFIFVLASFMNEFGVNYDQTLRLICDHYTSLDYPEIRDTVSSAFKRGKRKVGTRSLSGSSKSESMF